MHYIYPAVEFLLKIPIHDFSLTSNARQTWRTSLNVKHTEITNFYVGEKETIKSFFVELMKTLSPTFRFGF